MRERKGTFWESRRTTNEGTLTICLPTLRDRKLWVRIKKQQDRKGDAPDVPLADEDTSVMDRLGKTTLEDLSLESPLHEILNLEGQHVIETHLGLIEHTDTDETTDERVSFEQSLGVFYIQFEKLSSSTTDFGESESDTPDFALVSEAVLACEL